MEEMPISLRNDILMQQVVEIKKILKVIMPDGFLMRTSFKSNYCKFIYIRHMIRNKLLLTIRFECSDYGEVYACITWAKSPMEKAKEILYKLEPFKIVDVVAEYLSRFASHIDTVLRNCSDMESISNKFAIDMTRDRSIYKVFTH